jgi:orotidine-5'-phosphate decarboxylase
LELLTAVGAPQVVQHLHRLGASIFFDGKFDDIPNTVGQASRAVSRLGVRMFDVHASSGEASVRAAAQNKGSSLLLAVTVLTSFDELESQRIFGASSESKVALLSAMAAQAGADGIVCSPRDLPLVEALNFPKPLLKVTPGVRPRWAEGQDQKRTMTPAEAIRAGATHLVIGRPILRPPAGVGSPVEAAKRVLDEIREALA